MNPSGSAQVNTFSTEESLRITEAPGMGVRSPSIIDFHRKYGRIGVARDLRYFWFVLQSLKLGGLAENVFGDQSDVKQTLTHKRLECTFAVPPSQPAMSEDLALNEAK